MGPSGKVVEYADPGISMIGASGAPLWSHRIWPTGVVWSSPEAITVVTTSGIVRLDPVTGSVKRARCGWAFGLSSVELPGPPGDSPCAELR